MHAPSRDDDRDATAVDGGLRRRSWLIDDRQGRLALAGPAPALGDAIDAEAAALFVRHFGARAVDLPTLLVGDGPWPGPHDEAAAASPAPEPLIDDRIATAACHACATVLRGQPLGGQGEALTWRGRVLWAPGTGTGAPRELRLRALALVGSEEQVSIGGARLPSLIDELAAGLGLPCRVCDHPGHQQITLAAEPAGGGAPRQLLAGTIRAPERGGDDRLHPTTIDGRPAAIVWLGLTLESWVRAAFSQHGFEPGGWPAHLRERVFG